ncbi:hypothetical protein Neosp_002974 [[Neocosmospora] mangrovei]
MRFLAPDMFSELRLQIPSLEWDIPDDVAFHLGDRQQMQDITTAFLLLSRPWMPIVNGRRHLAAITNPLLVPMRRPRALLTLCMKLYPLPPDDKVSDEARHSLYLVIKKFYADVERVEDPCLEIMQAAVLIAVFEMGDAIYPAAYFTIGALARYGLALGLDKINQHTTGAGLGITAGASWIDIEEMRRVWWGALILDSLSTTDPLYEDYLPVDDEKFRSATSTPEDATRISEGFNFKMGAFARLCQATFLISKALELTRKLIHHDDVNPTTSDPSYDLTQLCRTLEALVRVNEFEVTVRRLAFCAQSIVSYLGIFVLQQHHWQHAKLGAAATPGGAKRSIFPETQAAVDTLDRISKTLQQSGSDALQDLRGGRCTVFLVDLVYQALLILMTEGVGRAVTGFEDKKESLKWLLSHLRLRWPLASVYEGIIQAREAMLAAAAV